MKFKQELVELVEFPLGFKKYSTEGLLKKPTKPDQTQSVKTKKKLKPRRKKVMSLLNNVVQNEAVHFRGITKGDAIIYNSPRIMLIGTNL